MSGFFSVGTLEAFLISFATLMIFSFLYRDNPFYKFAEHVFVGTSAGYGIVLVWFQILRPNLIDRLVPPVDAVKNELFRSGQLLPQDYESYAVGLGERFAHGEWVYYVFLVLGVMMLMKITKKLHWVSRWPLAYVIGAFAGIQIIQAAQGSLIPQVHATMKDFAGQGTVQEMLAESGQLPDGEWEAREAAQREWLEGWLTVAAPDRAPELAGQWQAEISARQKALADPEMLRLAPRRALKPIRSEQWRIVQDEASADAFLRQRLGGRSLDESLLAAALGGGEEAALEAERLAAEGLAAAELDASFTPACVDRIELEPWQDDLLVLATRVWLESRANQPAIEELLEPVFGAERAVARAEILARPPGRASLVELLKRGAMPDVEGLDWDLPVTQRLADSLLTEVNGRPARLSEWNPGQVAAFKAAALADGGLPTLAGELSLRLSTFDGLPEAEAGREAFLAGWRRGIAKELRDWRMAVLLVACNHLTAPDLLLPFSREQASAFRADPAAFTAHAERPVTAGETRLSMLIEILSNLLVVVGVCSGVIYFFFSKKHVGALGVVSKVGIAFLMMSFGASFGYTVMGRISLAIGRFQDLMLYPWMAGFALLVLIVALAIEGRRRRA